jgi:hypothetical protein
MAMSAARPAPKGTRRRSRDPTTVPVGRKAIALALAIFASVYVALAVGSYVQKSATWDEPVHVTDGYASLVAQDHRVDPEHPPFLRMWAALPLLAQRQITFQAGAIESTRPTAWASHELFLFAHRFMYVDNDADRMLYAARAMTVLLGLLLGVLIFCWAMEWFGFATAALTLALYVVEPNLMAHASLVTTDLGVTTFIFGAIYFLWRTLRHITPTNVVVFVLFTTVALVSKFSALLLFPVVAVLLAITVFWYSRMRARVAAALMVLMIGAGVLGIWAVYSFRYTPGPSPSWVFALHDLPAVRQRVPTLAAAAGWIDAHRLLPNGFTEGLVFSQAKAQERSAFLAGRYSPTGWWYYFPIALLIKTPLTLIVLAISGLVVVVRSWGKSEARTEAIVLVPIGMYLGAAMTSKMNIGLRHVLPIYPFILMVAAASLSRVVVARRRALLIVVGVCAAAEFATAYPHTLAFFNALVGGPSHGSAYLVDSNLDWGQDLKPLKKWMDEQGVKHVNLAYFGSADPAYYGINCTYLPGSPSFVSLDRIRDPRLPGYVAVSATLRSGVYFDPRQRSLYEPFSALTPVATIGQSIFVYWVEKPWW